MSTILSPEQATACRSTLARDFLDLTDLDTAPLYNDSDSGFSTHPGDVWVSEILDTSGDPWSDDDLAKVRALNIGESVKIESRDVTIRRVA